jgi:hypothetical protein
MGDIQYGHMTGQIQGIALKGFRIAASMVCKIYFDLPENPARETENSLDCESYPDRFVPYGTGTEDAIYLSSSNNLLRATLGATQLCRVMANSEDDSPPFVLSVNILVSTDTETMIKKKTCGHAWNPP